MISASSQPLFRITQAVWYILYIVEGLLVIRFALKLFQANAEAIFTSFIYTVSNVLVFPFAAVFRDSSMESSVFEWTTLLAMLVYWLLAVAIVKLFVMSKSVSATEADQKLAD